MFSKASNKKPWKFPKTFPQPRSALLGDNWGGGALSEAPER